MNLSELAVMIAEIGKWNIQKYADMDNSTFQDIFKYGEKFWWRVARMQAIDPEAEDGAVVIFDLAGFDNRQFASPKGKFCSWILYSSTATVIDFPFMNFSNHLHAQLRPHICHRRTKRC